MDTPLAREMVPHVIAAFPVEWRAAIRWANVSDSQCCIELWAPISEEAALAIGKAFQAGVSRSRGHP